MVNQRGEGGRRGRERDTHEHGERTEKFLAAAAPISTNALVSKVFQKNHGPGGHIALVLSNKIFCLDWKGKRSTGYFFVHGLRPAKFWPSG